MRITLLITSFLLLNTFLSGCAVSTEVPAPTAIPSNTPIPTEPPLPTDPPTSIPEPTSTPMAITKIEEMVGPWERTQKGIEWRLVIEQNGEARDWTEGGAWWRIDLWFEDGNLYHNYITQDTSCDDMIGTYEVSGVPGEYLTFTVVEDECVVDRGLRGKWTKGTSIYSE